MTRRMDAGLLFSVCLHAGLALYVFNRPQTERRRSTVVPAIEVRLLPSLGGGAEKASASLSGSQPIRPTRAIDPRKLFALAPSSPQSHAAAVAETTSLEPVTNFGAEAGALGFEAWGEGAGNPFWTHFARTMHERLKFLGTLHELNPQGKVLISLRFRSDGSLDPKSVRSESAAPYLQVYALRELCRAFCDPNETFAPLVSQENPGAVLVRISFVAGARPDYLRDPAPKLGPHLLDIERRLKVSAIQLGKTSVFGSSNDSAQSSLNLGWSLEIESLLSASHRKRYGWSGAKVHEEGKRAFKKELERLRTSYQELGWI